MGRFVVALLVGVLLGPFVPAATARACSCAGPRTADAALAQADVVFRGRVIEIIEGRSRGYAFTRVRFVVERRWKGPADPDALVRGGYGSGDCSVRFVLGQEYLVYAYDRGQGILDTHLCSRTSHIDWAEEDLDALGPGTPGASERTSLAAALPRRTASPTPLVRCPVPPAPFTPTPGTTIGDLRDRADVIFRGTADVIALGPPGRHTERWVTFAVGRAWKGEVAPQVVVTIPYTGVGSYCGELFPLGKYLIYAVRRDADPPGAYLATRVRRADEASDDYRILGPGWLVPDLGSPAVTPTAATIVTPVPATAQPVPATPPTVASEERSASGSRPTGTSTLVAGALILMLLGGTGYVVRRRAPGRTAPERTG